MVTLETQSFLGILQHPRALNNIDGLRAFQGSVPVEWFFARLLSSQQKPSIRVLVLKTFWNVVCWSSGAPKLLQLGPRRMTANNLPWQNGLSMVAIGHAAGAGVFNFIQLSPCFCRL